MKGKFIKKLAVMIMVTSFLSMTSATAFAQSAGRGNNFSIIENIPNAQAVQLSDTEMKEVKGELFGIDDSVFVAYLIIAFIGTSTLEWAAGSIAKDMRASHDTNKASGRPDPVGRSAIESDITADFSSSLKKSGYNYNPLPMGRFPAPPSN